MAKVLGHNLDFYFRNGYKLDGKFDLPYVRKQKIDLNDLKLIRFSSIVKDETKDTDATIHFFEPDERFDEVWENPESYLAELAQYKQVMTPDFSLYSDMPLTLQLMNTHRSRWCGAYWQEHGLTVIPTIGWCSEWSFEFCFDAVEFGSVVAVATLGVRDCKQSFMAGFSEMCKTIDPEAVICYDEPFEDMYSFVDVIHVPYLRNTRIAQMKDRR
ncbi:MAG: DUF4417 domain-containing protein [Propionibacteriaceae bacterium]|jgi:hypothetical protein|nr:DUF4417 domain-containing protein [Propionibacteriaceae bacterium]